MYLVGGTGVVYTVVVYRTGTDVREHSPVLKEEIMIVIKI